MTKLNRKCIANTSIVDRGLGWQFQRKDGTSGIRGGLRTFGIEQRMFSQIWLPLFLSSLVASTTGDPEPHRSSVKGAKSEKLEFPWITHIEHYHEAMCAGSLINADTMITGAHCSKVKISPFLRVYARRNNLGIPRWMDRSLKFSVKSIAIHPDYTINGTRGANDVAVWKLKLMRGKTENIPLDLVELDDGHISNDPAITKYKVAGWGGIRRNRSAPSLAQRKVEVMEVPKNECKKRFPNLHSSGICTKRTSQGSGNSCTVDAGGPLFLERGSDKVTLVGIASYGIGCRRSVYPTVYTKISSVLDWIKAQI